MFERSGELGRHLRAVDWAATPLGRPEEWPQSLESVVRLMLTSRFSMWMAWGPDLTFFLVARVDPPSKEETVSCRLDPAEDDEHGRGLQIVAALATRWGTRPTEQGKAVWCLLSVGA